MINHFAHTNTKCTVHGIMLTTNNGASLMKEGDLRTYVDIVAFAVLPTCKILSIDDTRIRTMYNQ